MKKKKKIVEKNVDWLSESVLSSLSGPSKSSLSNVDTHKNGCEKYFEKGVCPYGSNCCTSNKRQRLPVIWVIRSDGNLVEPH